MSLLPWHLLPWHKELAERITTLIAAARLPHGLLITATEGWGEIVFARWLALTLLDESLELDAREIAHPDLRWVKPDGAQIKVDAIREVGEFAFKTSQRGGRKVVVLEEAHLLNRNAANALLKTLEEPPESTFVVLASSHPGRLLPTIKSRCQRFAIRPDTATAQRWLREQWTDADIDERLRESGGAPLLVAAELEAASEGDASEPLGQTLVRVMNAEQPLRALDDLLARDPGQLTAGWYRHVKDQLAENSNLSGAGGLSARRLLEFADELLWVRHQLVNTNSANARLLMGRLVVRWHSLGT